MTLISRLLGFLRDVLLAVLFGAGPGMDAFLVAFKIPNFMRRLFAEGAFAQSFVPVLSETQTTGSREQVRELIAEVSGTLAGVLVLVTVVGVVAAPLVISVFAPGFIDEPDKFALATSLLRITFPYLLFIALTALVASALNAHGQFALPALAPALLNISLIVSALWLAPHCAQPVTALAIGVFVAGLAQLGIQLPALARLGLLPRPRWAWASRPVRRILKLMVPILFGSSVAQIALLLDTILASLLMSGSVSWLYYADRLMEFPLGIFSIAIATVILPQLSRQHASGASRDFSRTLDWALQLVLLICVPAAVGLFMLAGPLLATLFQYSAFTADDVRMARLSLMAYAFGLVGFSLVKILTPGYFARQNSRTPVRYGIVSLVSAMSFNAAMVSLALWRGWSGAHMWLAIGTSLGAFVNAALLLHGLRADGTYHPHSGWRRLGIQLTAAVAALIAVLAVATPPLEEWLQAGAAWKGAHLAVLIAAGGLAYFTALGLTGLRPRALMRPHTDGTTP